MLPMRHRGDRRCARPRREALAAGHNASTMPDTTIIATRESRLALWQAEHVRDLLQSRFGLRVELLGMTTRGDQILDRALSKVGGKGLFVKELEAALEDGRAHLAVHSLKDMPMELPAGFALGCGAGARRPARCLRQPALCHIAGRCRKAPVSAPPACAARRSCWPAARPAHRALARQPRHAAAQARRGPLRRHRAGCRRAEAPGPGRAHRSAVRHRADDAGRRAGRAGHRDPRRRGRTGAHAVRAGAPAQLAGGACRARRVALAGRQLQHAAGGPCGLGRRQLRIDVALGHAQELARPLLRTQLRARVASDAEANALGERAAAQLRAEGAEAYLAAAA